MAAKIISILNQKGGVGKTTVSMQLAGTFARRGFRTMVVDADRQGSATRWASSAGEGSSFPANICGLSLAGDKVHKEVAKYVSDYDVIIIDCPPALEATVPGSALLVSDLALIPIIPSPTDLWAMVGIRELIAQASVMNEDLVARLVPNMVQPQTEVSQEVLAILNEKSGIPITESRLCQRTAHRQSAALGGTVHDMGSRAADAIREVDLLADEVLKIVKLTKKSAKGARAEVANA